MSTNFDTQVIAVPLTDILVGKTFKNIRTSFDKESIQNLAENIHQNGLMNPIVVMQGETENGDVCVELVAGERRMRAIRYIQQNLDADFLAEGVPCIQYVGTILDAKYANASENIDREDVDDVDISAWLYDRAQEGIPQTELAERLHRAPSWVSTHISFHERACDELKEAVREKLISFGAACELARNIDPDEQAKRIEKARKFNEKITIEQASRANDRDKSARPSKKAIEKMLARVDKGGAEPEFHRGTVFALRWVLGLTSEQEMLELLSFTNRE